MVHINEDEDEFNRSSIEDEDNAVPSHSSSQDNYSDTLYVLSDEEIDDIIEALDHDYEDGLVEKLSSLSNANAADLISKISEDDRNRLLQEYSTVFQSSAYAELPDDIRNQILSGMGASDVANILSELDSDDALEMVSTLEADFQNEIMKYLSAKMRLALEEGLSYPEDSAGRLMQREFVAVPQFWTVGQTIDYLRTASAVLPDDFFDIFVISPKHNVVGEIPLNKLIRSVRAEKLETLTLDDTHPIPATLDQEEVAQIFRRDNLTSAPVVDSDDRLIGVITIDDIVDVIDEEAQEDILKLAGVETGDLYSAVFQTTTSRFRWLFLNLLTAIAASLVIGLFQATLEQIVAVAILMPIVASMGGNAGTQALTVAVRSLSMRELSRSNAMRIIWKETLVGFFNGAAFAIIMGVIAALWFDIPALGVVIAIAMIINLIVAGLCGAGIPIILDRMGSDPAVSSTVLLTTMTDIIGFFVFLGLAGYILL